MKQDINKIIRDKIIRDSVWESVSGSVYSSTEDSVWWCIIDHISDYVGSSVWNTTLSSIESYQFK
jgi:hypothetical protein